jgi:hypothetical protein
MSDEPTSSQVTTSSDPDWDGAFQPYIIAVGTVMHAWNKLHDSLGQLFVAVSKADRPIALSVWYSISSDQGQRKILKAAIDGNQDERWLKLCPTAKVDLQWLLTETQNLSERRNDAAHAPCALAIDNGDLVVIASFFHGNPRATKLKNVNLIEEFQWCSTRAYALERFAKELETAIHFSANYTWPGRPELLDLPQKSTPPDHPPQR